MLVKLTQIGKNPSKFSKISPFLVFILFEQRVDRKGLVAVGFPYLIKDEIRQKIWLLTNSRMFSNPLKVSLCISEMRLWPR